MVPDNSSIIIVSPLTPKKALLELFADGGWCFLRDSYSVDFLFYRYLEVFGISKGHLLHQILQEASKLVRYFLISILLVAIFNF